MAGLDTDTRTREGPVSIGGFIREPLDALRRNARDTRGPGWIEPTRELVSLPVTPGVFREEPFVGAPTLENPAEHRHE
jgi:hypothetical protein